MRADRVLPGTAGDGSFPDGGADSGRRTVPGPYGANYPGGNPADPAGPAHRAAAVPDGLPAMRGGLLIKPVEKGTALGIRETFFSKVQPSADCLRRLPGLFCVRPL